MIFLTSRWFLTAGAIMLSVITFSQDTSKTKISDHRSEKKFFDPSQLVFGGNFGAGISGRSTVINLAPSIGYRVTERFTPGFSVTYIYYYDPVYHYSTDIYGGSVFGKYIVYDNFFVYGEYEVLNFEVYEPVLKDFIRTNVTGVLLGGGYRQPLGGRVYMDLMALWNFGDPQYSPYSNPIIRMGFSVGMGM